MHVYTATRQDGLDEVDLPATGYHIADGNSVGWQEAMFTRQEGVLKLHTNQG